MDLDVQGLIQDMRVVMQPLKIAIERGEVRPALEVGPKSLVQIMQAVTASGKLVTWNYLQAWVYSMSQSDQNALIGMYLNDRVGSEGQNKIIGIYENVHGSK